MGFPMTPIPMKPIVSIDSSLPICELVSKKTRFKALSALFDRHNPIAGELYVLRVSVLFKQWVIAGCNQRICAEGLEQMCSEWRNVIVREGVTREMRNGRDAHDQIG